MTTADLFKKLRLIATIGLGILFLTTIGTGVVGDYRSCHRSEPARTAFAALANYSHQVKIARTAEYHYWQRHHQPQLARTSKDLAHLAGVAEIAEAAVPPIDCSRFPAG